MYTHSTRTADEALARKHLESIRKSSPRTQADFAVLYNDLDAWRLSEVKKIKVRR